LSNLLAARVQMGFTLGFHMLFAAFGVGFPLLMLVAERIALRGGGDHYMALARTWGRANALLFAVGAVSGTALSFELGLLWPGFMRLTGSTIGVGFATEAFAFFVEAIFIGLYLYGWNRLSPRAHWWTGVPIALSGAASAALVIAVDAWMQHPVDGGALLRGGVVSPLKALFANPHWFVMATHATIACYAATAFTVAAVYAWGMLRGRRTAAHRAGLRIAMVLATGATLLMPFTGDLAGKAVARFQPTKLAAMESQFRSEAAAPLRIGGLPDPARRTVRYDIEIPGGLSWLAYGSGSATVRGLDAVPPADWPDVPVTHVAFQLMVGSGTLMVLVALLYWWSRRRTASEGLGRLALLGVLLGAPLAFLALETGWVVTEVGRQPWIVYGLQRTADAVTPVPGLLLYLVGYGALYLLLGTTVVLLLRGVERAVPAVERAA